MSRFTNLMRLTASEVQDLLTQKKTTSVDLVKLYLRQIQKHDSQLHAMVDLAPESRLLAQASRLDAERARGQVRSRLHGIPVIIKDNIATALAETGLRTTAGNFALAESRPARNAAVVQRLLDSGAILLGKSNMSELSFWKGQGLPCGWSAVTGQTQSAYVVGRGGSFSPDRDTFIGHSNPAGSSSGSAVALSGGFAPLALGTESQGSLVIPAGRAALYSLKPTVGALSRDGVVPVTPLFDSPGPMAKTVRDLADMLDVLAKGEDQAAGGLRVPPGGFAKQMTGSWADIRVAALDPATWTYPDWARKPDEGATRQMLAETAAAYGKIKAQAKSFSEKVPMTDPAKLVLNGLNCIDALFLATHESAMDAYLATFAAKDTPVHSLKELVAWNKAHADVELPPGYSQQDLLEQSIDFPFDQATRDAYLNYARQISRQDGFDRIFVEFGADVLIGPIESPITYFAAAAGYPTASLPLGYLEFNGRPHGLAAIVSAGKEALLVKVMSAWEATIAGERQVPSLMEQK